MKILYITTIGITMSFFKNLIRSLLDEGHQVDVACNETEYAVPDCYREWGCRVFPLSCSRSPLSMSNLKAIGEIKELVTKNQYDIVHCHTPVAAACTRLACIKARKKGTRVFYTAHGFHFYKGAPLTNWLIFYPVEKFCAHLTDVLVTINQEDYQRAQRKLHAKKVVYVPGVGIDVDYFKNTTVDKSKKRKELGIPENARLMLSVGELNENKNHQIIIRAMARLNEPDLHYMIAGEGPYSTVLAQLAKDLNLSDRVHLLGYRTDVNELYHTADIFCFPSYREGLSVSVLEAMASAMPVLCSKIRGNVDLVDLNGGFFFDPKDTNSCSTELAHILTVNTQALGDHNLEQAVTFGTDSIIKKTLNLYNKK